MQIINSKPWIEILGKNVTLTKQQKEQIFYIEKYLTPIRWCELKIISNFIKYNVCNNLIDQLFLYRNIKSPHSHTLENYIIKFGKIEGTRRYDICQKNRTKDLKTYIEKYGIEIGTEKYQNYCRIVKESHSLDYYIKKYGDIEAHEKKKIISNKVKNNCTLERFIEKYGAIEGTERWSIFLKKRSRSPLQKSIDKHGIEKGTQIIQEVYKRLHAGNTVEAYIQKHGEIEGPRLFKEQRTNRSLAAHIRKYGPEQGPLLFKQLGIRQAINSKKYKTLSGFIERFGHDDGIKKFEEWKKKLFGGKHQNNCSFYSKISQKLFDTLYSFIKEEYRSKIYYATLNQEFCLRYNNKKNYFYDFVHSSLKKIIEFHGDIYHANPTIYFNTDKPCPFTDFNSQQIWEKDAQKENFARTNNYELFVVWEYDYRENPGLILEKCKNFIGNEYFN